MNQYSSLLRGHHLHVLDLHRGNAEGGNWSEDGPNVNANRGHALMEFTSQYDVYRSQYDAYMMHVCTCTVF